MFDLQDQSGLNSDLELDVLSTGPTIPRDGTLLGGLFEHLVTMSVLTYAQPLGARVTHLRQQDGRHEIDVLIEKDGEYVAVEVKLAPTVKDDDVKHLHWLKSQLKDSLVDAVVITTGPVRMALP